MLALSPAQHSHNVFDCSFCAKPHCICYHTVKPKMAAMNKCGDREWRREWEREIEKKKTRHCEEWAVAAATNFPVIANNPKQFLNSKQKKNKQQQKTETRN